MRLPLHLALALASAATLLAQTAPPNDDNGGAVRVNVTINPDGSRTTYRFDTGNHKASAETATPEGRLIGKTNYRLDESDRFGTSVSFDAKGKFRFKSLYKYDAAGRLEQETQLARDDSVLNKIVYSYNSSGRQTGYTIYDAAGKVIDQRSAAPALAPPVASPQKSRGKK